MVPMAVAARAYCLLIMGALNIVGQGPYGLRGALTLSLLSAFSFHWRSPLQ
jgi:hypothetical protein